jgi:ankyrin repeat protein
MYAARWGDVDRVKAIVEAGADLKAKDNDGHTALEHARNRDAHDPSRAAVVKYLEEKLGTAAAPATPPPAPTGGN